ncbi:MAG: hypothetical protein JWO47_166 [Candidatus Saccharibacteria bacterium]|nr:hypothetical protein [Candidatus Saccharibacteria bacterium]
MTIEALSPDRQPDGGIGLNGNPIKLFIEEQRFPNNRRQLAVCEQHLEDGPAAEYAGEWYMGGCMFPGEGEDQIIRAQFVCPGPGIMRNCRFRIDQYDAEGEKVGGFKDAWEKLKADLPEETKTTIKRVACIAAAGAGLLAVAAIGFGIKRAKS